jgi:hypothetical protein
MFALSLHTTSPVPLFLRVGAAFLRWPLSLWAGALLGLSNLIAAAPVPNVPSVIDAELKTLLLQAELQEMKLAVSDRLARSYGRLQNKQAFLDDGSRVRGVLLSRFLRSFDDAELLAVLGTDAGRRFLVGLACDDRLLKGCFGYDLSGEKLAVWPKGALAAWVGLWGKQSLEERRRYGIMAAACAYALNDRGVVNYKGRTLFAPEVYAWLKKSDEAAKFVVSPEKLTFDEICLLAVVPRSVDEMDYLWRTTPPKGTRWETVAGNCWRVKYTLVNAEGISIHNGQAFYKGNPGTVDILEKMGGVCGAVSKFGVAACRSRGVPATAVGQPGHCAFIWLGPDFKWHLANDIGGWEKANGAGESYGGIGMLSPWGKTGNWLRVVERLRLRPEALRAELLLEAAEVVAGDARLSLLKQATAECAGHPAVWRRLLAVVPRAERSLVESASRQALAIYPGEVYEWVCAP